MVIPNFFITFVRHSFHTSHTLHIPLARDGIALHPCHQALHFPHAHALPHALSARDCLTRCTSQGLCHTRHTHATHPHPHSTLALHAIPPRKGYATRATHTLCILALTAHTPSALPPLTRATPCRATTKHESHTPPRTHAPQVFCEESASPITTKILHITILHVTFTRIGVKTTQKSEAIFSFID